MREQVAELLACDADVRVGRNNAVHKMRVATRRLRSCLQTFRGVFPKESARHLSAELKWLGTHLGAERDAEVVLERIAKDLSEPNADQILGTVRASLMARTRAEIVIAQSSLIEAMNSARYRSLLEELAIFEDKPTIDFERRGSAWLTRQLAKSVHRTQTLVKRANKMKGAERDAALHEIRKATKHVRYAAETLAPRLGRKYKRVARTFEMLQEILGEHHDAVVTRSLFRDEGVHSDVRPGVDGFSYGLLFAREEARAAQAEARFAVSWKRARHLLRGLDLLPK
jgi:CHAD domain-containing protein